MKRIANHEINNKGGIEGDKKIFLGMITIPSIPVVQNNVFLTSDRNVNIGFPFTSGKGLWSQNPGIPRIPGTLSARQ